MNQLTQLYEAILKSIGLSVDENGLVSMVLADDVLAPFMCEKKRLVIPNHDILRRANWDQMIAFHPLSENITRSESPVLIKTKRMVTYRLVRVLSEVLLSLMNVAVDKDKHKFLSPEQVRFLQCIPDADHGTYKALLDIIDSCEVDKGEKRLVNIFQRRAAIVGGKNYQRGSIVTFPIVTEFHKDANEIYGVDLRVKDKQSIVALFNWVLPNADTYETYSAGSSSMVAPFFDSLVRAFLNVAKQLNKSIDLFANVCEDLQAFRIDTSWEFELDGLAKYRDLIPPLEGNEGATVIGSNDTQRGHAGHMNAMARDIAGSAVPASLAQPQQPIAPVVQQPMVPQAPMYQAPQAPVNPRTIVINDPNFKPLGGGTTATVSETGQPVAPVKTPDNDWNTFTERQVMMQRPQLPVFPPVGGMPPQQPMAMPGMMMQPNMMMAPGMMYPGMPMQPAMPVAYGNMAMPGYTQYPAYPGQYQPQQQQTGLPVFAAVR